MTFVEQVRIGKERAKAGFGAEQYYASAVFCTREILRISIFEDSPT